MMKINHKLALRALSFLALLVILAGSVYDVSAQRRRRPRARTTAAPVQRHTIPVNTIIRVRLNDGLNSRSARVGDRFSTTVTEPVYAGGAAEVIPVGSRVWGRVQAVRRAGRRTPGTISVSFYSVELPTGYSSESPTGLSYPINGSLTSLQADDVNADNESTVQGKGNRKRDAVFIGGGAAAGALIGAIAGGGKGAAIGAILGGGLGTGARVYEKESEAEVKSGTEFGVILNRSVSLPARSAR